MPNQTVLGTFFGDTAFPIEWKDEQEKSLHWFYDDLHCPLSPSRRCGSTWAAGG